MPIDSYKFASILEKWIKIRNIDIDTLAAQTNIDKFYISNVLKGLRIPSKDKLKRIVETLNAPLEEFLEPAGYTIEDFTDKNYEFGINTQPFSNIPSFTKDSKDKPTKKEETKSNNLNIDIPLVSLFPKYDLPVEFIPLIEKYKNLTPEKKNIWLNCCTLLLNELNNLKCQ